jgi:hypothetical protein
MDMARVARMAEFYWAVQQRPEVNGARIAG